MTENKKALLAESNKSISDTFSIPQNPNEKLIINNMPEVLKAISFLFKEKHINISYNCILNVLLAKTAQMITSKRVTFQEVENELIPNWYSIIFMPSGGGKDRLSNDLDKLIFSDFREWFKTSAKDYRLNEEVKINRLAQEKFTGKDAEKQRQAFINSETEKIRNIVIEMQDGTQEGFYADAKSFSTANFGSLFLKISEFGLYLKSTNTEKEMFLNCLYNAYDGKVISKCIKGSNREPDIENLPVNVLLYSDYTLFKKDIKDLFNTLMTTGLNRRAVVSFKPTTDRIAPIFTYEQKQIFNQKAKTIRKELEVIFNHIQINSCYRLSQSANDNILNQYVIYLNDLHNKTDNQILKSEIISREIKVLKLSCLYACLNHPQELVINETDLKQAIITVQGLSNDLSLFDSYRPPQNDKYDLLYQDLKANIGKQYTKLEMVKLLMSRDWSRRKANKEFGEIITDLKEIALNDDCVLMEEKINNNSGTKYYLYQKNKPLENNKIIPLNNLLTANAESVVKPS